MDAFDPEDPVLGPAVEDLQDKYRHAVTEGQYLNASEFLAKLETLVGFPNLPTTFPRPDYPTRSLLEGEESSSHHINTVRLAQVAEAAYEVGPTLDQIAVAFRTHAQGFLGDTTASPRDFERACLDYATFRGRQLACLPGHANREASSLAIRPKKAAINQDMGISIEDPGQETVSSQHQKFQLPGSHSEVPLGITWEDIRRMFGSDIADYHSAMGVARWFGSSVVPATQVGQQPRGWSKFLQFQQSLQGVVTQAVRYASEPPLCLSEETTCQLARACVQYIIAPYRRHPFRRHPYRVGPYRYEASVIIDLTGPWEDKSLGPEGEVL